MENAKSAIVINMSNSDHTYKHECLVQNGLIVGVIIDKNVPFSFSDINGSYDKYLPHDAPFIVKNEQALSLLGKEVAELAKSHEIDYLLDIQNEIVSCIQSSKDLITI